MTDEDRRLVETTARALLDINDRLAGIEIILLTLIHAKGDTQLALAKLKVHANFLRLKGTHSAYLDAFVERANINL